MKLTTKEISYLSKEFPDKNQIGLFSNITVPFDGSEQKSLEEKDVYQDGGLSDSAKELLGITAKPLKCTRFILKDNACVVEKYAYKVDGKIVLVENAGGEMLVSSPENFNKTILELSEFTGMSNIKTADIEVLLPVDEALVLLAMMDICRKNAMLLYIGQETANVITFGEIRRQLDEPASNSLLKMLVNNYNYTVPKIDITKKILDSLVAKNIAAFTTGYVLTPEYAVFAKNFLIPDTVVMLETFQINEKNELATAGVLCVSAGLKNIVTFIFSDGEIEISSITGSYMLRIIENFLNCPDIV